MAKTKIIVTHDESAADMTSLLDRTDFRDVALALSNYFAAMAGGWKKATVELGRSAASATGTITFSGVGAADDTVLINGVTFTAKASGATGNEWNVGASATLSAAALAAAINASATALVSGHVTASAASGVVTITAKDPGVLGNAITIAEGVDGSSHMAVSGARLTGGTEGTEVSLQFG